MFTVLSSNDAFPKFGKSEVFLVQDNWNDWFKFKTQFSVFVFDETGTIKRIGNVKIGESGLVGADEVQPGKRAPSLPSKFSELNAATHFSLGQEEDYYQALWSLPESLAKAVLVGLRDCAYDLTLLDKYQNEDVMRSSLMRYLQEENVRNRFHRLAHGNAVLTRFEFNYTLPAPPAEPNLVPSPPVILDFLVNPGTEPPSNLHVLTGRNGAGKTRCIQGLINSLIGRQSQDSPPGVLNRLGNNATQWNFSGLVFVTFSAFDDFEELPPIENIPIPARYVGLRGKKRVNQVEIDFLKGKKELASDFVESLAACREGPKRARWLRAVEKLSSDDLFAELEIERFFEFPEETWRETTAHAFQKLSSGHSIVLLSITRLVELVGESTLVILDEPEGHLHPPLLSAFVRAISDLLIERNGVAIIATHSPVVLQEVPRQCVWTLSRSRLFAKADRPDTETFGESTGVLTRSVFGLQVSRSGFNEMVEKVAMQPGQTFDSVTTHFSDQLGSEAKALVRSLIALQEKAQ